MGSTPQKKCLMSWHIASIVTGKVPKELKKLCKGVFYRSKSVPLKTKCQRVVSHVFGTALNGSINRLWSVTMLTEVRSWDFLILRLALWPNMYVGESWRRGQCGPNGGKWACQQ